MSKGPRRSSPLLDRTPSDTTSLAGQASPLWAVTYRTSATLLTPAAVAAFDQVPRGQRVPLDQFHTLLIDRSAELMESCLPVRGRPWRRACGHQTHCRCKAPVQKGLSSTRTPSARHFPPSLHWTPLRWTAQIFAFFPPLPVTFFILSSLPCGSSLGIMARNLGPRAPRAHQHTIWVRLAKCGQTRLAKCGQLVSKSVKCGRGLSSSSAHTADSSRTFPRGSSPSCHCLCSSRRK